MSPRGALRGQTLISLLAALAIIAILAGGLYFGMGSSGSKSSRPDGKGTTIPGAVKMEAKDEVCRNQLQQIRTSLQVSMTTDDAYPATLQETRLGASMLACPIGKEPYQYDAANGVVKCPHPGHESY